MSHYAHQNLSLVTQINVQNAFRAMAFLAETSVFAYLGMAIFSFQHKLIPSFLIWTIILILLGRALNIYPLCYFINHFRDTRITRKMQFVMWFRLVSFFFKDIVGINPNILTSRTNHNGTYRVDLKLRV